jgi:hypothetical protein
MNGNTQNSRDNRGEADHTWGVGDDEQYQSGYVYRKGVWAEKVVEKPETNIEKARRLYPKGTKYICFVELGCVEEIVESTGLFKQDVGSSSIWGLEKDGSFSDGYIFRKHRWAEIVKEPEEAEVKFGNRDHL